MDYYSSMDGGRTVNPLQLLAWFDSKVVHQKEKRDVSLFFIFPPLTVYALRATLASLLIVLKGIVSHVGSTLVMVRCRRMTEFYDEIINHKLTPHPYMLWQDDIYGLIVSYATT